MFDCTSGPIVNVLTAGTHGARRQDGIILANSDYPDVEKMVRGARPPHRAPLGQTGWELWREAVLAGAGFPVRCVMAVCDNDLAVAADALSAGSGAGRDRYDARYTRATEKLSAAIREIAAEPQFREAVTWQQPALLATCLDKAARTPRDHRGRGHELVIARYLQRYCLNTETLGFYGPVGWARVGQDRAGLDVTPGRGRLSRRTTYFDWRAIDMLATRMAERPEVLPWLTPRLAPSAVLDQGMLRLPFRAPMRLPADDARLLRRCDGTRTVAMLAGDPPDAGSLAALLRLRELGAVEVGLQVPVSSWPEQELADRVRSIADPGVRGRALAEIAGLVRAKDAVSAAAGDAARVHRAVSRLSDAFEQVAGHRADAGRPLVYEDAVRDVEVRVGKYLTDALAGPLGLLLDSAAWLVNTVAARYRALFWQIASQARSGNGTRGVPLLPAALVAMPELFLPSGGLEPAIVAGVVAEFQERWHRVLGIPSGVRRHHVTSGAVAGRVAREFATGPPPWDGAKVHSLDILIAAATPGAVTRGECQFVLGKLHPATNVLENRVFRAQHPEPGRLLSAAEADHPHGRVYAIPKRDSPVVTSRLSPPSALLSPRYTYLCLGAESVVPPEDAPVLPAADLSVEARGEHLIVCRGASGPQYEFAEVIGEMLAALVAPAFRPLGAALAATGHLPRISLDEVVIGRESWVFPAREVVWAFVRDERQRYAAARQWRTAHGLPERVFVSVAGEGEQSGVDFRSLPLVSLLARAVRRAAKLRGSFTVTEMLPDVDQLWLRDADGDRYTAQLSFVAVDGRAP